MTVELSWTPQARRDLADMYDWVALDRPRAAEKLYQAITNRAKSLCGHPYLGKLRPELQLDVRVLNEDPYLIFYSVAVDHAKSPRRVDVLRVLHGSRFTPNLFQR